MMSAPSVLTYGPLPEALGGERLDRVLVELAEAGFTRSRLARWIREGRVRVDGRVARKPGQVVEPGQVLELTPPEAPPPMEGSGEALPVLLHQDRWLVVLDKPAGLPMHGNHAVDPRPSVARFLAERFGPHLPVNQGPERPGIVHRLDKDTSGVCVAALEQAAFCDLQEQFAERSVEKEYEAVVYGRPRFLSDWVDRRIARDPRHPERMRVTRSTGPESRDALTYWEVRQLFEGFAHILVRPRTGRMHQIRVHLCAAGLPLVGDPLYRARNFGPGMLPGDAPQVGRTLLHASRLAFQHPVTGEGLGFRAPLPPDMAGLLAWLAEHAPSPERGWS